VIARNVVVSGRVQGVGFRWSTRARALALGVAGRVRNLPNGKVEAHIEGSVAAVDEMMSWLRSGPAGASVTGFEESPASLEGITGFAISG